MELEEYFATQEIVNKKRYDALHDFIVSKHSAEEVAHKYGYTVSSLYSLVHDFKKWLQIERKEDFFFQRCPLRS
jgi:hypothetical protein